MRIEIRRRRRQLLLAPHRAVVQKALLIILTGWNMENEIAWWSSRYGDGGWWIMIGVDSIISIVYQPTV